MSSQEKLMLIEDIKSSLLKLNINLSSTTIRTVIAYYEDIETPVEELKDFINRLNKIISLKAKLGISGITPVVYPEYTRNIRGRCKDKVMIVLANVISQSQDASNYTFDCSTIENGNIILDDDTFDDSNVMIDISNLNMENQTLKTLTNFCDDIYYKLNFNVNVMIKFNEDTIDKLIEPLETIYSFEKRNLGKLELADMMHNLIGLFEIKDDSKEDEARYRITAKIKRDIRYALSWQDRTVDNNLGDLKSYDNVIKYLFRVLKVGFINDSLKIELMNQCHKMYDEIQSK